MSEQCHVCGPVKHEAPTVICAPCALADFALALGMHQGPCETDLQFRARIERSVGRRPGDNPARWGLPL